MRKNKQRWNLGLQTSPGMNRILMYHAEWLDYNVSKVAGDKMQEICIKNIKGGKMNEHLFRTLLKRYEAVIEDCIYKIQSLSENNIIIPEHVDITGEADKLLQTMAEAEDKVAVLRKYYVKNKADAQVL